MPEKLFLGLEYCQVFKRGKWVLYRHPDYKELASRDHHSYFIIYRKLLDPAWTNIFIKNLLNSYSLLFFRGMNLWMKSLTGNKRAQWWYYFWNIPGARLGNWWNRLIKWIGDCGYERSNEWWLADTPQGINRGTLLQNGLSKWQKFWLHGPKFKLFGKEYHIEILLPAYALHVKAWQIYVMPKTPKRDTLRKILIKRVGKSNLMLRLLLGDTTVTQEEVDNYPHMTGYRPGVYLDETCRRDIRELTPQEAEANTYERDLIIWL